ncbi:MAG TPA: helix-turn-helix transcriptional regulator [Chitinophaga sp.]|uniref:helix-turn-helix transcriptional regulator n=1 Tax=Chitinophaga sp. TaxID=1869181 RepID=UPI002B7E8F4C|nr:helix-turn-helix transcriptional regulator [Chitinophaga sp.]HVI49297.1 helix-turn-helix transcriptional regulator [Chitinophaga sp.]
MQRIIFNRIKEVLAAKRRTNKDLAEAIGVTQQAVSKWVTNRHQPSIPILYRIAEYLQVQAPSLLLPEQIIEE